MATEDRLAAPRSFQQALGFLIFSPVAPYQFQQLVLRDVQGLGAPLIVGVIGLSVVLLLTLRFRADFSAGISARSVPYRRLPIMHRFPKSICGRRMHSWQ